MALRKASKRERSNKERLKRRNQQRRHAPKSFLTGNWFRDWSLVGAFVLLLAVICFLGQSPAGPSVVLNQVSNVRIVADVPFRFSSEILTEQAAEQRRARVPPVYRLEIEPYEKFASYVGDLVVDFEVIAEQAAELDPAERRSFLEGKAREIEEASPYPINFEDILVLLQRLDDERRGRGLQEGLVLLRQLYRQGVYNRDQMSYVTGPSNLSLYTLDGAAIPGSEGEVQSQEEALRYLRINLFALDLPREASLALFRILRSGLEPNLEYDPERTEERIQAAMASTPLVYVRVEEGETIVEPGTRVGPREIEQLNAYRQALQEQENVFSLGARLWKQLFLTVVITLGALIYLHVGTKRLKVERGRLALVAGVILVNLAVIRLILELGETEVLGETAPLLPALLPYLTPVVLGSLIVAVLVGSGPAIFVAVMISFFNAMMQGDSFPLLVMYLLASLAGVSYCRNVQVRTRLVTAGALTGLVMAMLAGIYGLMEGVDTFTLLRQIAASLGVGIVSGIVVVGLVPILEKAFGLTTDVTLLELTDYNHPLLRRMQIEAPGTYHHSLMVANLSENAAAAIGANALLCRAACLFHDIGKMTKPEYFTENQREGINPHLERNPSMSALVIKAHVKEGVELAQRYKLPRAVIQVIKQHHGTTLIQYFFYKAKERQRETVPPFFPGSPKIDVEEVNESTYRYDGPKPDFKESGIILFADSIEAASRCLKKVTPQAVEDLVDSIVRHKVDDEQLSECPLTFAELDAMKKSFSFTLLNMLHARVEYPDGDESKDKEKKKRESAPPFPGAVAPSVPPREPSPASAGNQ